MNFTNHLKGMLISKLICGQYMLTLLVSSQTAKHLSCVAEM